jgi:hypothetical protein
MLLLHIGNKAHPKSLTSDLVFIMQERKKLASQSFIKSDGSKKFIIA